MTAKKLLYPFLSAIMLVAFLLLIIMYHQDLLYGMISYAVLALFILIGIPVLSFIYGIKILRGGKRKILFGLYNALISTIPYTVLFYMDDDTYLYSMILFLWCALWTFVSLIPIGKKNK